MPRHCIGQLPSCSPWLLVVTIAAFAACSEDGDEPTSAVGRGGQQGEPTTGGQPSGGGGAASSSTGTTGGRVEAGGTSPIAGVAGKPAQAGGARSADGGSAFGGDGQGQGGASPRAGILFDVDLTGGVPKAPGVTAIGGAFDEGWVQVAGADRLVFDLGRKLEAGFAEVTIAVEGLPSESATTDKAVFFSVWEHNDHQGTNTFDHYMPGSKAYLRVRKDREAFVELKAHDGPFDRSEGEARPGERADWKALVGDVATLRLSWTADGIIYEGPHGPVSRPKGTNMRYVVIGSEDRYNARVPAFRYLRVRIGEGTGRD